MDGDRRRAAGATDAENPMDKILEQMQRENFSHAPGEEMTHVAGVSFVDDVGLSLGAAPREEAERAGAYRHIANCANALESLVLDQEDADERDRLERERERIEREGFPQGGQGEQDYSYQNYHDSDGAGHHQLQQHHSSHLQIRSSTRLRGDDRHIVIERNPENNQVAAVVLKTRPEHDSDDSEEEARDEGEDTLS